MAEFKIVRNEETCVGCNECVAVCPQSAEDNPYSVLVAAASPGDPPEVKNDDNCIQCLRCADHCRCDAIDFENAHRVEVLIQDEFLQNEVRKII